METVQKGPPDERCTEDSKCEFWQRVVALPLFTLAILLAYLAYIRVLQ